MSWWTRGGESREIERIVALERAVEGLESRSRLLKMEWASALDKMNSVMGRLNARIRKSEGLSEPESDEPEGPKGVQSPIGRLGSHATLAGHRR